MPFLGRVLERLTVAVDGDTSDAERELHGLADEARGGAWAGRLGGLAAKAGAAMVAGVGAGAAAIGGLGLASAAQAEQASIAFGSIMGDAGKAKAFLADLNAFAAQTPFELPGLRDAASRLLAVGTQATSVIPLMRALGDATSAMGTGSEGINRAVTALTQMQVKGKVTGEEMLQLAEAGVPAWDALATVMGVSVAEAQKKVSDGQVKVATLFQAIETSAGPALGRVKGMMDAQSQSLAGMWSTLKDTLGQGLAEAMGPAVVALKGALPDVTSAISESLAAVGPQIGELVAGGVGVLRELLPAVAPLLGTVSTAVGSLLSALGPALRAAAPLVAVFAENLGTKLAAAFDALGPVMPAVGEALGVIAVNLGGALASTLATAAPLFADLLGAVLPLLAPLSDLAQNVLVALLPAITPLVPPLTELIRSLVGTAEQAGPLVGVLRWLTEALHDIPTPVLTALVAGVVGLKAADGATGGLFRVTEALGGLGGPASGMAKVFPSLSRGFLAAVPALVSFATAAWAAVAPLLPFIAVGAAVAAAAYLIYRNWSTITDFLGTVWSGVVDAAGAAWEGLVAGLVWIGELPGRIVGWLAGLPGMLGHLFAEAVRNALAAAAWLVFELPVIVAQVIPKVLGAFVDLGAKVVGWVVDLAPALIATWWDMQLWLARTAWDGLVAIVGFFAGLPGRIIGALPGVASALWGLGTDIVRGLWDGAWSMWQRFWGFVTGIPGFLLQALPDAARWLWDVGGDVVRGLWNGLQAMTGWIKEKVGGWIMDVLPDQVKGILKIFSPSRVMADLGRNAGLGMAEGLLGTEALVSGAAGRLAGAAAFHVGDMAVGPRPGATPGSGPAGAVVLHLPDGSVVPWSEIGRRVRVMFVDDAAASGRTALVG